MKYSLTVHAEEDEEAKMEAFLHGYDMRTTIRRFMQVLDTLEAKDQAMNARELKAEFKKILSDVGLDSMLR